MALPGLAQVAWAGLFRTHDTHGLPALRAGSLSQANVAVAKGSLAFPGTQGLEKTPCGLGNVLARKGT